MNDGKLLEEMIQSFECHECGNNNFWRIHTRPKVIVCTNCKLQISFLKGTIYEKSRTPLSVWKIVENMIKDNPNVPIKVIERKADVTYKTAWRMVNLIKYY